MLKKQMKKHIHLNIRKNILDKNIRKTYVLLTGTNNKNFGRNEKKFMPKISVRNSLLSNTLDLKTAKFPLMYAEVFHTKKVVSACLNFQQNIFDKNKPAQIYHFSFLAITSKVFKCFNTLKQLILILRFAS